MSSNIVYKLTEEDLRHEVLQGVPHKEAEAIREFIDGILGKAHVSTWAGRGDELIELRYSVFMYARVMQ